MIRHEALVKAAFPRVPVTILCPYDTKRLEPGGLRPEPHTRGSYGPGPLGAEVPDYGVPSWIWMLPDSNWSRDCSQVRSCQW